MGNNMAIRRRYFLFSFMKTDEPLYLSMWGLTWKTTYTPPQILLETFNVFKKITGIEMAQSFRIIFVNLLRFIIASLY
jgi:hypothetical protein